MSHAFGMTLRRGGRDGEINEGEVQTATSRAGMFKTALEFGATVMTKAKRLTGAFVLAALIAGSLGTASAQGPVGSVPYNPPAYSPYLNLTRRGNSAAANYFGLVRPELAFRNALRGFHQQAGTTQLNAIQEMDAQTGLPVTGHVAVFMNTGGYFMSTNSGTNTRSQTPAQAAARVAQQGQRVGALPPATSYRR